MTDTGLVITYTRGTRAGVVTLTAKIGDEAIAVESLTITKSAERDRFADLIGKACPAKFDPREIDNALRNIAAEVANKADTPEPSTDEIDVARILRPERFTTTEVSGVAVPLMSEIGGKPVGRWELYLRWSDGRRERRTLMPSLATSTGEKFWIHPQPAEPTATDVPQWSRVSRQGWLAGTSAPSPADVFRRICERIAYYIDLPAEHAPGTTSTLALWTMLSYCFRTWDAAPYLFVGGPLGSGKSRVFEILSRLVFRPVSSSNTSAANLFRTLHQTGGTFLYDEAERLKQTSAPDVAEINSMLLAGYKRGGCATRLEAVGDSFKAVTFDVYSPKALACIAGLPPALASRCIPILMFRASPDSEKPRRRIDAHAAEWQALRDDLHAVALEHGSDFLQLAHRTDVCPKMSGRDFELWQPILALATWVEDHGATGLSKIVRDHAKKMIDHGKEDQTPDADETLLHLLAQSVRSGERPTPAELLDRAQHAEPSVFKTWWPRTVTARLRSYGIPTPRKSGSRREFRDVTVDLLSRIQSSYGIDLDCPTPATTVPNVPTVPPSRKTPEKQAPNVGTVSRAADGRDGWDGIQTGVGRAISNEF